MTAFVSWDSQPLDEWADRYAAGVFVRLDGRRTHYIVRGEGQPVILLHGFNLDSFTWHRNIDALAQHFKVYVPDLWGLGFSTREPLDYGYPLYAEQLRLFMDHFGIQRASLVGHSLGGGTCLYFSLHNRARVSKLVLVDAAGIHTPLPLTATLFNLPGVGEFLLGLNTNFIRRKNLKDFWIYNHELLTEPFLENATRFQKIDGSTQALLAILRKRFFHTLDEEIRQLGQMAVPSLIIWGREDRLIPQTSAEQMHRLLSGSRLEIFEEAGHLCNYEKPELFNQLVTDFLLDEK